MKYLMTPGTFEYTAMERVQNQCFVVRGREAKFAEKKARERSPAGNPSDGHESADTLTRSQLEKGLAN